MLILLIAGKIENLSYACQHVGEVVPFMWLHPRDRATIAKIKTAAISPLWLGFADELINLEAYVVYCDPIQLYNAGVELEEIQEDYKRYRTLGDILDPCYYNHTCGANMHRLLENISQRTKYDYTVLRSFLKAHRDEQMFKMELLRFNITVPNNTIVPMKDIIAAMMNIENYFEVRQLAKRVKVVKPKV